MTMPKMLCASVSLWWLSPPNNKGPPRVAGL
jgi:hypothetical protein